MKLIILLTSLFMTCQVFGQNIILPDGEYMDTTSNTDTKCKNYNAYYYQVGGKYPESSSSVLKEVRIFQQKKNKRYFGSGYITFRFTVDCEGKVMKKIQVMQTDEMYKPYHFSRDLVNELFLFFNTMKKWKIAKTKQGDVFNYFAFIAFKINNGKVINIIP
ncbi:MAG TPA: hypothetical protein VIJ92_08100 [Ginsengibacter sp.]